MQLNMMQQAIIQMASGRLAFVALPIEGEVTRTKRRWEKNKGFYDEEVQEPGGYLCYFPKGHVIRLTEKQLKHHGLDRQPNVVSMTGLLGDSLAAEVLRQQDHETSQGIFGRLEEQVIALATAKTGPNVMPELAQEFATRAKQARSMAASVGKAIVPKRQRAR